jgi:type IV pilus assembly protein PilM
MLKNHRILALDMGTSAIKMAEFVSSSDGSIELVRFGVGSLGLSPGDDEDRGRYVTVSLRELMREREIRPGPCLVTVSGHQVFSRFVKLPPVETGKIAQIVACEAQQNVPFPIDEVVWDYQLIGVNENDLDVMIAAIKGDIIEQITAAVEEAGCRTELVDVAPMALYNAARFNGSYEQGCTLLVDMGARSTDLVFLEEGRVFIRSIPLAGNTITQNLAKELNVSFEEAEDLKIEHGWLSPGAAYEEPEGDTKNRAAKVVRNVMTRMHAELNRSVNFYRGQQGGGQPQQLLLAGGTSLIRGTDAFFREKLKIPVDPFNPFANVAVSPAVDAEEIAQHVGLLAGVVGLGLRGILTCPIEINLSPPQVQAARKRREGRPIWIMSGVGGVLALMVWCGYYTKMAELAGERFQVVRQNVQRLESVQRTLAATQNELAQVLEQIDLLQSYGPKRERWNRILTEIRASLPEGMWLESIEPVVDGGPPPGPRTPTPVRGRGRGPRSAPVRESEPSDASISVIEVAGHGYLDRIERWDTVRAFRDALQASPLFSDASQLTSQPPPGDVLLNFEMRLVLEEPIPL